MTQSHSWPAATFSESRSFHELTRHYAQSPSAILIRTAEAELLRGIAAKSPMLDLCCGDGYFASLIRESVVDAGCDFNGQSLRRASRRGIYRNIAMANVTQGIPFQSQSFETVISNSSLEHVDDINAALAEVSRVLRPGGTFHMTLASEYAYAWWPCGDEALSAYRSFQPVYSSFSLGEWTDRMADVGLKIVTHRFYLSRRATRCLMYIDYHLSNAQMTQRRTLARPLSSVMRIIPRSILSSVWRLLFARVGILQENEGGGLWITAERRGD